MPEASATLARQVQESAITPTAKIINTPKDELGNLNATGKKKFEKVMRWVETPFEE